MDHNYVNLDQLPTEIIERILFCDVLTYVDICRLSCVSQNLYIIGKSNRLWQSKFLQIYPLSASLCDSNNVDWRYELQVRHNCRISVLKKLREMYIDFYYTDHVSNDQFSNFRNVCVEHPLSVQIIIDELWRIVSDSDRYHWLTLKYYAKIALKYMRHIYLEHIWQDFLSKDKNHISLLKGACLLSQWCQPTDLQCTNSVSENINAIVKMTVEEVERICPNHPLLKQRLPVMVNENCETLQNSVWDPHHCKIILRAINKVIFNKLKFRLSTDIFTCPENNYIDKVLASRSGIPLTLCIVYETVASQLGVSCLPVSNPGYFLLKWLEHPNFLGIDAYTFIDICDRGAFKSVNELTLEHDDLSSSSSSLIQVVPSLKIFTTMCWNLVEIARQQDVDGRKLLKLCNVLELLAILTPADIDHKLLLARVYMHLCINMTRVISLLQEIIEQDPLYTGSVSNMYRSAITALETQKVKSEVQKIKYQLRNQIYNVKFAVGMIMKHKKYNYRCVIYGWDNSCAASQEWKIQMGIRDLKYRDQQPFYMVLVDDGTERYAAQENLIPDDTFAPINNPAVGRYFESFHGSFYLPNEQKLQEYPDDSVAREKAVFGMKTNDKENVVQCV
ncbi:f-box only protein 21 [Trichonephila inaurata madagascariensis]|uniref:F-box only protein 21 n=1 Tax=Trichonephila inaurata madagascariensis TaxID=2747483 RepID=A0A8X6Y3I8_9ARAC|nr:f-box only protein 21 [Trichonephila inaurata madagascariensis]